MADKIVEATVKLYTSIARDTAFNPSARKFHYQFNLRELSRVAEGVMQAQPAQYRSSTLKVARLWSHECKRVFSDRLICEEDM